MALVVSIIYVVYEVIEACGFEADLPSPSGGVVVDRAIREVTKVGVWGRQSV